MYRSGLRQKEDSKGMGSGDKFRLPVVVLFVTLWKPAGAIRNVGRVIRF